MKKNTKKNKVVIKSIVDFKENDLTPKGRTNHTVETDWPTKELIKSIASENKKIKNK